MDGEEMMAGVVVQQVEGVAASGATDGGAKGILELRLVDGPPLRLEMDAKVVPILLAAVASIGTASDAARRQQYGGEAVAAAMHPPTMIRLAGWNVGSARLEGGAIIAVLQLEIVGGAKLSFPFDLASVGNLAAALQRLTTDLSDGGPHRLQ